MTNELVISNRGTRAVFVSDSIASDGVDLLRNWNFLCQQSPQSVNRCVLKSISYLPYQVGENLGGSNGVIEACIPFNNKGESLYWLVIGKNSGERGVDYQLVETQRAFITQVCQVDRYRSQTGEDLKQAIFQLNPGVSGLVLERITPANFLNFKEGLRRLYEVAFSDYPYDIVEVIKESCDYNFYVVALVDGVVAAVTGAERIQVSGIQLAEVGDSAALPNLKGLGAVTKRFLLQLILERDDIPSLLFTDSRIGDVLKANRRAGFQLNPEIILPWHTQISSPRNGDNAKRILGDDDVAFSAENMTMTYLDRNRAVRVIEELGPVPI
jgi:hypothetical protein